MAKPEIIGYEPDPDADADAMRQAVRKRFEFGTDERGFYYAKKRAPHLKFHPQGDSRASMRLIGMRPVYRKRDFKATLYSNREGCSIRCRKCGYHWSTYRLPHDSAERHTRACRAE